MADLDVPDDLVELQRAFYEAQDLLEAFGRTSDAERRAVFPGEDQVRQRMWPQDSEERAELQRLREARNTLMDQVREHPAMVAARADGTRVQLDAAVKKAARALIA